MIALQMKSIREHASLWRVYCGSIRPPPDLSPSEFAEKYRILHPVYCSERPGRWSNDVFPYQPHAMNAVQEAMRTGKRGVVFLKGGQLGGTEVAINGMLWLKIYYPGPQLFMTATEKVASEFGRERFESIIRDMPPLMARYCPNPRGDILTKRFVDGKIQLSGGQSVFNLQSTPYRMVVIDELDSLVENLGGEGDPVKLAEVRTDSFTGQTLMIAYAHPTTKDRGAGKLYYELSDQRRGFVKHDCGCEFYLKWEDVKCSGDETDPGAYDYICPQCAAVISDAERVAMVRKMVYRSVLPPEVAAKKTWIGMQFGQLLSPAKSIRGLAQRFVECGKDENPLRVFYNKVLGEPYEPKVQKIDIDSLRALIVVKRRANDPEFYSRGQVPPGVRFLTAGQDSRSTELHFAIWGWGLRRATDKTVELCGWLIDWGAIKRQYSLLFSEAEYHVFDELIYRRVLPSSTTDRTYNVMACGHDIGYQPTQIPIIRFCRSWPQRAIPVKGASITATSATTAPYARWGHAMKFKAGDEHTPDETSAALLLNTFMLKNQWYGSIAKRIEISDSANGQQIGSRKVAVLAFPEDVEEGYLEQSKNEAMGKGKRRDELVWEKTGPNHYADCNTYAFGLALNFDPYQKNQTPEEAQRQRPVRRRFEEPAASSDGDDILMG
jgi:phage terminase large subunit GpA-like protein